MSEINEIHADIYSDGRVQLNKPAQTQYKKEIIKNIIGRSFYFLLGGAFLLFSGYVSTYSFLASFMSLPFGVGYLYLTFSDIKNIGISIDNENVEMITDDNNNNWLLKTLFNEEGLFATQKEYDEICKSFCHPNIKSFKVNNKKVIGISTQIRSYSVSEYCKKISPLLYQQTIADLRHTIADLHARLDVV